MKIRLTILFLTSFNICLAQESSTLDSRISIKTSPLSLIDVYGGYSYRLGAECKVAGNVATSIEFGKYFNFEKGDKLNLRLNTKGFIIKPELKVYLNKTHEKRSDSNNFSILENKEFYVLDNGIKLFYW